ncbi:MAG TPA: glycosyltransferase family 1 protein [bacterium]|nr:glycosyltransferase family 1 protein [bacterium]
MTSKTKKNLRVGIDARLAYRRGVGTYTANLILALSKIDRRDEYFIFNAPKDLKDAVTNPRFHWVKVGFTNAAYYEQVLLPWAARRQKVDLLHYVDNSASATIDIPFVLTLHDTMHTRSLWEVRPKPTFRQRMIHRYKQWAIPRSVPKAQAILTVSEFSKEQILRNMGVPKEKVFAIPEGVDLRVFQKSAKRATNLFKILVHGAADNRKNIPNILKAARLLADELRNFQLVIIGMDQDELNCTTYLQEVEALKLARYVEWMGNIPNEMVGSIYHEVDLFLYPSRLEGFGLPVLEAFASGVPVITSNTTSLPEVAGKAAFLVNPEDPAAMAQAMRRMMDSKVLRKKYIRLGLQRAKQFSWEKTAKQTLKVYEGVLV